MASSTRNAERHEGRLRSVAEEAQRLGVSKGSLYLEIREGRFPHIKFGTRILLDPAHVDEFLARNAVSVEEALSKSDEARW